MAVFYPYANDPSFKTRLLELLSFLIIVSITGVLCLMVVVTGLWWASSHCFFYCLLVGSCSLLVRRYYCYFRCWLCACTWYLGSLWFLATTTCNPYLSLRLSFNCLLYC